jgi:hypothetical protein
MARARVYALVTVAMIAAVPLAQASPAAAPAPTLRIATTIGSQQLARSPMSGAWHVTKPGRIGELSVSGVVVTGTVTTVATTWTSGWRLAREHAPAIAVDLSAGFRDLAPGTSDNGQTFDVRFRTRHSGWLELGSVSLSDQFIPLSQADGGLGYVAGFTKSLVVQWRVTVRATFHDTSTERLGEKIRVF